MPESILNSLCPKANFHSITILESNSFPDTDCSVCVVCLDSGKRSPDDIPIYRNNEMVARLGDIERARLHPTYCIPIVFNVKEGRIALRAVDLIQPKDCIRFMLRHECNYPAERIKISSCLITFIEMPTLPDQALRTAVSKANDIFAHFWATTADFALLPFKGNTTQGKRRRRLDYYSARAILERAAQEATGSSF